MKIEEMENYLIDNLNINEEVVNFATSIYGYNEETINNIIYYYFGYNDIKQYLECEDYETYKEYYKEEN
jgi:hypothetical protein